MPIKGIARKGDKEAVHCSRPYRDEHFRSVFANGIPVSGKGHKNTTHLVPAGRICVGHSVGLIPTQATVFAEGKEVGRVNDPTCTKVIQGSSNVFVGGGWSGGRNKTSLALDIISFAATFIPVPPAKGPGGGSTGGIAG
jgi:hypothetical protein